MSEARVHERSAGSRWIGRALGVAAVAGAAAALAFLWGMATRVDALRFRTLLVNGELAEVTPDEVRALVAPHLAAGFFGVDLEALRAELEALPWVASAAVRREWPGTLRVSLREEKPVAIWRDTALLNAAGDAFAEDVADYAGRLPSLAGPEGTERQLLEMHAAMADALTGAGLEAAAIALSERRAWEVTLAAGPVVRLGRRDALPRLARFARVARPVIASQLERVAYVDMRYTNGFAVGWRRAPGTAAREVRRDVQEA